MTSAAARPEPMLRIDGYEAALRHVAASFPRGHRIEMRRIIGELALCKGGPALATEAEVLVFLNPACDHNSGLVARRHARQRVSCAQKGAGTRFRGVGGLQGGDIGPAHLGGRGEVPASPREPESAQSRDEEVGGHPGLATVAVGEGVDGHEPMVKADGELIRRIGLVLDPVADVADELVQFELDPVRRDADVRSDVGIAPAQRQIRRSILLYRALSPSTSRMSPRRRPNAQSSASLMFSWSASFSSARVMV